MTQPEGEGTASSGKVDRDSRIDFVRGVALLTIHADHIRPNLLADLTPRNFGLIDMADVFVFVSGYVGGIAYGRVLESRGFRACQRKALVRASQLVLAYVITLLVLHMAGELAWGAGLAPDWIPATTPGTSLLRRSLGHLLEIDHTAGILDILSLYVVLLLALPTMLRLGRRHAGLMLGPSVAVYTWVQVAPEAFARLGGWRALSGFDPFAWQFLFFAAAALGTRRARAGRFFPGRWPGAVLAFLLLESACLARLGDHRSAIAWTDKGELGPLRVVNLYALVTLGRILLPSAACRCWGSALARPLIVCGRNPLVAFCAGAIAATVASQALTGSGDRPPRQVAATVLVWVLCVLAATLGDAIGRRKLDVAGIVGCAPSRRARPTALCPPDAPRVG